MVLYSPNTLLKCCTDLAKRYDINLDVEELKVSFSAIFWNLIWYFDLNELPYNFIISYQDGRIFNFERKMKFQLSSRVGELIIKSRENSSYRTIEERYSPSLKKFESVNEKYSPRDFSTSLGEIKNKTRDN